MLKEEKERKRKKKGKERKKERKNALVQVCFSAQIKFSFGFLNMFDNIFVINFLFWISSFKGEGTVLLSMH